MLSAERIALLKHGAPPRNALEAALRNVWYGGGASYEKTVGPAPIISISDAKPKPAKSLIVGMEPIQDLHGYDSPWPAGGGKNKCYADESHLFPRGDGLIIVENAETLTAYAKVTPNTDYVFSCATTPFRSGLFGFESEPAVGVTAHSLSYTTPTTTSRAFNSGSYEWVGMYYGKLENPQTNVMIEAGESPTSFAPYSNICPISGRTGLNVYHSGEDTSNPAIYPISWQTEAGTVYGGTVDLVSGALKVDRYYFKGGWTLYGSSNGFRAYRRTVVPYGKYLADVNNKPMSNTIGKFGSFSSTAMTENIIQPPRSNSNVAYMALDENLSPDDIDLTYLIAEPQTYQLTPQQIQLLKGSNTLWSDGDTLTLTYLGTTPANLLGGMLGLGNTQEPIEETSEEPTEGEDE